LNRLVYYPTGCYGTFVQWLCNTTTINGTEDLPFDVDGNSHKYVLSNQYRLLISDQDEQNFVSVHSILTWYLVFEPLEHNGKMYNTNYAKLIFTTN
jgi:hypothetical protein